MGKLKNILSKTYKSLGSLELKTKVSSIRRLLMIAFILLASFATRFYDLEDPKYLVFDENFFIPIAQKYQSGEFFGDPHPPLGRLIITSGAYIFGNKYTPEKTDPEESDKVEPKDIFQYRVMPAFFGSLIPILVFFIIKIFTRSDAFSFLGSLLIIFDNALTVHTRFALFDEILLFFILMTLLLSICYVKYVKSEKKELFKKKNLFKKFVILIFAGIFAGASIATKLTGLTSVAILYLAITYKTNRDKFRLNLKSQVLIVLQLLIPLIVIAGVFFFSFWIHFNLLKFPGENLEEFSDEFQVCIKEDKSLCKLSLFTMTEEQIRWSFNYESRVPSIDFCKEGEMGSLPTQWPFMARAIAYSFTNRADVPLTEVSYVYLTGNPVVWYSGLLGVALGLALVLLSIFYLKSLFDKKVLFLLMLFFMHYIPYFFIERVMYFYHYFPALVFSIILFSYLVKKFYDLHKEKILLKRFGVYFILQYLLIVLISFLLYSPLTYNKKVNVNYVEKLILTDLWNLKSDPYNYNKVSE